MYKKLSTLVLMMSCGLANADGVEDSDNELSVSGNITVVSSYVARGLTKYPENEDVTLQGYLSLGYDNFYVAYWGSPIGYSFRELKGGSAYHSDKFEHNFIVGYAWDYKDISFDVWNATYYYRGGKNLASNELGITVTTPITSNSTLVGNIGTTLNDAYYMSQGDTYATLSYIYQFTEDTSFALGLGGSYFTDKGKFEGKGVLDTKKEFTYRYSTLRVDHTLSDSLSVYAQYYFGGYDRSDVKQDNKPVFGLTYSF